MIFNLQVLRALAVYLVVFEHSLPLLEMGKINAAPLNFGHAGVDLFFVISGFIMVVTSDTRETLPGDFMWHRVVRIVPLYWFITLAVFATALIAPALVQATRASFVDLAKSWFFIPFRKSSGLIQPVVFVGWTLNYEMFFYVLFAVSLFIEQRRTRLACMLAVLGALPIAGAAFSFHNDPYKFYTNPIILEFGGGMILGYFWSRFPANGAWIAAAIAGLIVGGCLIAMRPSFWPRIDRAWSFGIPAFIIVGSGLLLERAKHLIRTGWILLLGNASYSIYLTHFFVTQAAKKAADRLHVHSPGLVVLMVLASGVIVAFAGIFVHRWIELPLTRFFRVKTAGLIVHPRSPTTARAL